MAEPPTSPPIDDQARQALAALNRSAVAIAGELDVDKVLQLLSLIHI